MKYTEKKWQCHSVNIASLEFHSHQVVKLLALHGWLDNAASFNNLALCLDSVRFLAIDLPGHGYSDPFAAEQSYQVIDYIDVLVALIKQYNDAPIILLGHSLGGGIASVIASRYPSLVSHLILIDVLGPLSHDVQSEINSVKHCVSLMRIAAKKARDKRYDSFEQMVRVRMRINNLSYDDAVPLVKRGVRQDKLGWHWCFDQRLSDDSEFYFSEESVLSMLAAIAAPVLVVEASNGLLAGQPHYQKRLQAIKNLTHHVVQGGHHVHIERPGDISSVISEFLSFSSFCL